jgi:hypothetical protein
MRKAVAPTALAIVVMLAGCSGDGGAQGDRSPAAGGATPYIGGLTAPDLATGNGAVRGSTRAPVTAGVRSDGRFAQTRPIARPQTDGRRPAASPSASASGKPGTARPARPTRPTAGPTTGAATGAATPDSEPPTTSGAVTSGAAEQAETPPGTAAAHGMAESTVRFQEIEDAYADATRPLLQALAREPLDMAAVRQGVATATRLRDPHSEPAGLAVAGCRAASGRQLRGAGRNGRHGHAAERGALGPAGGPRGCR